MPDDKGFEVRDKRKVNAEADDGPAAGDATAGSAGDASRNDEPRRQDDLPVDFLAFASSLGATCLMHMGQRLSPEQPEGARDLAAARQMIDILDMLKTKTKGNLTPEEQSALENMLYNLRMLYVREADKDRK